MNQNASQGLVVIRPAHYRDREVLERLYRERFETMPLSCLTDPDCHLKQLYWQHSHGLRNFLGLFLNPMQYLFCSHPIQQDHQIQGAIQVSPFNRTRSTWRVDHVAAFSDRPSDPEPSDPENNASSPSESLTEARCQTVKPLLSDVGSYLLRYCFEKIWEARTWLLEVNTSDTEALALYRLNGFQPLAHMTYWNIAPEVLNHLAEREPDLPNLLPVGNADAQLLYQLDTASMPPLVRQVFDRHLSDFKLSLLGAIAEGVKNWLTNTELVDSYVFEPQRKAAIGYFRIRLCRDGSQPHQAQLTVHPAYTWLYSELMAQMARITQDLPTQSLQLVSSDYQPEREAYLTQLGATQTAHTLMMSRSVWHKVREAKSHALESLQLAEMLQGLKPSRKPVPSRIELVLPDDLGKKSSIHPSSEGTSKTSKKGSKRSRRLPTDLPDLPPEGPYC
jgi:hypothetical protein